MKNKQSITGISVFFIFILSGCYTYNIPSGTTVPLVTKEGENKISAQANFNEAGGSYTYALTNHVLFSSSGNISFERNNYIHDYDSMFYKKTPNNFEVAFGYYGSKNKFANNIMFGIGTGNAAYDQKNHYEKTGYFQTEFVQYFLQYNAGFKYQKKRRRHKRIKEQGLSLRYAYHNYHVSGISNEYKWEEVWNEEQGYYDYIDYIITEKADENNFFNSFSVYYFFRTGNDKIQFEVSPGFSFYDNKPRYENNALLTSGMHFNVGMVFNLNNLLN